MDRAFRIARAERTVTCLIIPKDVQELAISEPAHAHATVHSGLGFSGGAHVDGRIRLGRRTEDRARRAIEVRHRHGVASVDHVEQHPPAAPLAVDRKEDRHVGRPLDAPVGGARRQFHVRDAPVHRVQGIDREVKPALQFFVWPDRATRTAERRATGQRSAERNLEANNGHASVLCGVAAARRFRVTARPKGARRA